MTCLAPLQMPPPSFHHTAGALIVEQMEIAVSTCHVQAERESARGLKGQSKAEEAPQSLGQELQRRGQGLARDLSSRQPPPSTPSAG